MYFLYGLFCFVAVIKGAVCIPRPRQQYKDHTGTKFPIYKNKDGKDQINLEFLESKLLKLGLPSCYNIESQTTKHKLKRNITKIKTNVSSIEKNALLGKKISKLKKHCKRSLNEQRFNNFQLQTQSVAEDFFSLLLNNPSTAPTNMVGQLLKENRTPNSNSSKTSKNISTEFSTQNILSEITTLGTKKVARKIILPRNITNIKLENNDLYLKPVENQDNDISSFFNNEDDLGNMDVKENGEKLEERVEETTESTTISENIKNGDENIKHGGENIKHGGENTKNGGGKPKCESEYGRKCMCSIVSVKYYFNNIFAHTSSQSLALEQVKEFTCNQYFPVPEQFEINAHAQPKTFDKDKKPIAINQETGPKEIENSMLNNFISQIKSSSVEDDEVEVFPGADVFLPCFPTKNIHLPSNVDDDVVYKWSHTKNKSITEGNIKQNLDGEGTLFIDEATFVNSDNYTCTVEYINPDTGQRRQEEFVHTIAIVTLPIVSVHVFMSYKTASCDKSLTENFRKYLPYQMQQVICDLSLGKHLCAVEIHNAVCLDSTERTKRYSSGSSFYEPKWYREKRASSKELSLNYEVYIHKHEEQSLSGANSSVCDPNCHLLTILKLVQLLKENIDAAVLVPVYSEMDNNAETFNPIGSSVKVKYIFGCHDGNYHLGNGFCGPCPKNTYSKNGAIICKKCPPHSYQGNIASSECIFCKNRWIPYCNEFVEDYNIYMIIFVAIALIILIVLILTCYMIRVKNKTMADVVSGFIPREDKHRRNVKFGKSTRSPRTARTQVKKQLTPELQAMLDTEEDTEIESDITEEEDGKLQEEQQISKSKKRRARKKKLLQAQNTFEDLE